MRKLKFIKRDVIGSCEVRRTGYKVIALHYGLTLCYKGLAFNTKRAGGLLINKILAGNVEEFFTSKGQQR